MARQVRSEVTRRRILDAATDVFGEIGYAAAGWGAIIERTGMTKGALYHHFDSKESLASAVIEEGSGIIFAAFRNMCGSSAPALENMIHGMFAVADLLASNRLARVAEQLTLGLGEFNAAASDVYRIWLEEMAAQTRSAVAQGDLREDLGPETISGALVAAMFGTQLLSSVTPGDDPIRRLSRMWELLLPVIATDESLSYFREFLSRETLRQGQHAPFTD